MKRVPESEISFVFSRSGGAGGQNVNKVSTKVTLIWDFEASAVFSDAEKGLIRRSPVFEARKTSDGNIAVTEQSERAQAKNRDLAVDKLHELLGRALAVRRLRRKTRVSNSEKRKRLESKRMRSEAKGRRKFNPDY